jgi:DNA-binding MarR family transcriptional regulator
MLVGRASLVRAGTAASRTIRSRALAGRWSSRRSANVVALQSTVPTPTSSAHVQQTDQPDHRATALAEELYRVLFEVFLVLGRRDPGCVLPGDLTLAQLSILMTLQEGGPKRMTALAADQRVRTPTITVAIRRLEKLGLVDRSSDPTDLRAVVVRITPHGHAICCDALATRHVQLAAMLKTLSPQDHAILYEAMRPLNELACQGNA